MNPIPSPQRLKDDWTSGICDCFSDIPTCLVSFLFPCVRFYLNIQYSKIDNPFVCSVCCILEYVIPHSIIRNKIREKYNIQGSCETDFAQVICCPCCSIAQEAREINLREPK
jgi:Cys-rich protein (TIGR01571 family)